MQRSQRELDRQLFDHSTSEAEYDVKAVQQLLEAKANPLSTFRHNETALHCAQSAEIAQMLIDAKADVMARSHTTGNTPLHIACRDVPNVGCVKVLLKAKADPLATTETGVAALYAVGNAEIAQILLEAKADPLAKTSDGLTTLHFVKDAKIAQMLIDAKADVMARDNVYDDTPLQVACRHRLAADLVNVLLEAKADPLVKDKFGLTPLHDARTAEIAKALILAKADLGAKSKIGVTPLHGFAAAWRLPSHSRVEIVRQLIYAKADVMARCNQNKTPLDYAVDEETKAEIRKATSIMSIRNKKIAFLTGFHQRCGARSVLARVSQSSLFHQFAVSMTIFKRLSSYHRSKPVAKTSSVDSVIPKPGESRKRKPQ